MASGQFLLATLVLLWLWYILITSSGLAVILLVILMPILMVGWIWLGG